MRHPAGLVPPAVTASHAGHPRDTLVGRMAADPLASFTPQVRDWFTRSFERPTEAQAQAWPAIAGGENVLLSAPTGSGKTLAAFLWGARPPRGRARAEGERDAARLRLAAEGALLRRREEPARAAARASAATSSVAIRTGDTPQKERQAMLRTPPDVLITTPESLYLMLTSRAREFLVDAEAVIVDEIHAVARTKRGAHLALTLERLEHLAGRPLQRIGLSATQRPLEEVGRFLVGAGRDCTVVDAGMRKPLDLKIHVPVENMREPGRPRRRPTRRVGRHGHGRRRRRPDGRPASGGRRTPAPPSARSGRRSTPSCSSWCRSTARRSSS